MVERRSSSRVDSSSQSVDLKLIRPRRGRRTELRLSFGDSAIVSSGNLQLVESDSLRLAMAVLLEDMNDVQTWINLLVQRWATLEEPYLMEYVSFLRSTRSIAKWNFRQFRSIPTLTRSVLSSSPPTPTCKHSSQGLYNPAIARSPPIA